MAELAGPVLLVLPTLVGGGAEHVVRQVAERLPAATGRDVGILSLLDAAAPPELAPKGVEVRRLGLTRVRSAVLPLLRIIRAERPVAVLSTLQHVTVALGLVDRLLPRGTTHVARIANTYSEELAELAPGRARARRWLIRRSHRRIRRFVCVSVGVRDDLVAGFGVASERCTVLPNPVDVDELLRRGRDDPPADLPARDPGVVRFLVVGRLEHQKDHATLLRAFAIVRQSLSAELVVLGQGSLRLELERLAEDLGVRPSVRFLGFTANPYPVYASSQVLVSSSRYEGLPNVLLEALAFGIPCVSTDCRHGPAEILAEPDLGALVPIGDHEAMAAAMVAVAGWPAGAPRGPEVVRRRHDPILVGQAYAEVLVSGA